MFTRNNIQRSLKELGNGSAIPLTVVDEVWEFAAKRSLLFPTDRRDADLAADLAAAKVLLSYAIYPPAKKQQWFHDWPGAFAKGFAAIRSSVFFIVGISPFKPGQLKVFELGARVGDFSGLAREVALSVLQGNCQCFTKAEDAKGRRAQAQRRCARDHRIAGWVGLDFSTRDITAKRLPELVKMLTRPPAGTLAEFLAAQLHGNTHQMINFYEDKRRILCDEIVAAISATDLPRSPEERSCVLAAAVGLPEADDPELAAEGIERFFPAGAGTKTVRSQLKKFRLMSRGDALRQHLARELDAITKDKDLRPFVNGLLNPPIELALLDTSVEEDVKLANRVILQAAFPRLLNKNSDSLANFLKQAVKGAGRKFLPAEFKKSILFDQLHRKHALQCLHGWRWRCPTCSANGQLRWEYLPVCGVCSTRFNPAQDLGGKKTNCFYFRLTGVTESQHFKCPDCPNIFSVSSGSLCPLSLCPGESRGSGSKLVSFVAVQQTVIQLQVGGLSTAAPQEVDAVCLAELFRLRDLSDAMEAPSLLQQWLARWATAYPDFCDAVEAEFERIWTLNPHAEIQSGDAQEADEDHDDEDEEGNDDDT